MDNQQDTFLIDLRDGNARLPFHDFFTILKNNGFSVTTQQIIDTNRIIINYAAWVKNEEELCLYLMPIFAVDEDEQVLFKQLFLKYFKSPVVYTRIETKKESFEKRVKRNWKKIVIFYGLLALVLVALIIIKYRQYTTPDPSKISVNLVDANKNAKQGYKTSSFSVTPNQPLVLNTVCISLKQKGRFTFTTKTIFNWGDNSVVDDRNSHTYTSPGKYELVAYVEVLHNNKLIKKDTLHRLVFVCAQTNSLRIEYGSNNRVPVNKAIRFKAYTDPLNPPDYIKWGNESGDLFYGDTLQTYFTKPGDFYISCVAVYDSINSPCTIRQDIMFKVYDPAMDIIKTPPANDQSENIIAPENTTPKKTTSPFLFNLYLSLAIIFGVLAILFTILGEREKIGIGNLKKAVLEKYNNITSSAKGKKKPGTIPFRNKNYLPLHQTEIHNAARLMRKRVSDNSSFLHIDKTISKSIKNNGLLQPVMVPRTRQTEYLVLIDELHANSQQVKLYEYLLLEFKKQNILTEKFYYTGSIKYLYNFTEPKGISLEKLFTRYPNHVLLIFGDGHQLINESYHAFDEKYLALINRWQYKAVLTPVPYPDWGVKEKNILLPHIPVFPLDVEGILLMTEQLAGAGRNKDITSRLNQHKNIFYKTAGIDFENIQSLEKYCNHAKWAILKEHGKPVGNIIFQWVAALAVHPKLSWEVTITIGKAILDKYDRGQELNFTNLLRIARISWMKEVIFPHTLRLELLKSITIENEKLARETMLLLFQEIPASAIEENSTAREEKEIQQIIHEFSLYAHDPVFYAGYRESHYIYKQLWNEKKFADPAMESYFTNAANKWATLINSKASDYYPPKNTGIEEYFETLEKEDTTLGKFYLWLALISVFVFVSSLFALRILYQWKTATDV